MTEIPRFVDTIPGDSPDGFLIDGCRMRPISGISDDVRPPALAHQDGFADSAVLGSAAIRDCAGVVTIVDVRGDARFKQELLDFQEAIASARDYGAVPLSDGLDPSEATIAAAEARSARLRALADHLQLVPEDWN